MSPFPLQAAKDGLHDEHGRLGAGSLDDYGNVLSGFGRALWARGVYLVRQEASQTVSPQP